MPLTFKVSERSPEPAPSDLRTCNSQGEALSQLATIAGAERILQSSVDRTNNITIKKNGFVLGALMAYNKHHNLVIRPDDVWIAILAQLNLYINAHAEELRGSFVSYEGKRTITVYSDAYVLEKMDFGDLALQMTGELQKNLKDASLIPWMMPNFSTTTVNDAIVCSVLMMATFEKYFDRIMRTRCGIPYITLEGIQADWQAILDRIERIPEFGAEPTEWAGMLRVILQRFVRAFEEGGPQQDMDFWERIVHEEAKSGERFISGWMSAFCAWDAQGKYFGGRDRQSSSWGIDPPPAWVHGLTFDGVWFPRVSAHPKGYAEVDVKVITEAEELDCSMLAGHTSISFGGAGLDTINMAPQWFIYVKGERRNRSCRPSI